MILTVSDAARILGVSEQIVYEWIRDGSIPFTRVSEQYRFNRQEILEWATRERVSLSPLGLAVVESTAGATLGAALARGGVHAGGWRGEADGDELEPLLRAMTAALPLPPAVDRALVHRTLVARGALGAPSSSPGVLLPHVCAPIVLDVAAPSASLFYLSPPAGSVVAVFMLVTPTVRLHVHLLAVLAAALRDAAFGALVERHAGLRELLVETRRIDARVAEKGEDAAP
jgi:nitrogen PTS system EIIA component